MARRKNRYTVIGAGHGGRAMAAHLALMGYEVALWNRTPAHIEGIAARNGIEIEGCDGGPRGFGRLALITNKLSEAVRFSNVLNIVLPSSAHREIATECAPLLREGQIVVLHPGRTGGAIEFDRVLREQRCRADVTVAEAQTLLYACRSTGPAHVQVYSLKDVLSLAALPATRTARVLEALGEAFPQFVNGGNVLQTGLDNMGAILHPALTILNAGWIECKHQAFQFYLEGVSRATAHVLEVLDRERVTVAAALGVSSHTALEWLRIAYGAQGDSLYEAIHRNTSYQGIDAPATLDHRYIFEDVPMSLVPLASLGRRYGVRTRALDSIINLASIIHRTDYWRRGRTLDKLGINDLSVSELMHYVLEGVEP